MGAFVLEGPAECHGLSSRRSWTLALPCALAKAHRLYRGPRGCCGDAACTPQGRQDRSDRLRGSSVCLSCGSGNFSSSCLAGLLQYPAEVGNAWPHTARLPFQAPLPSIADGSWHFLLKCSSEFCGQHSAPGSHYDPSALSQ